MKLKSCLGLKIVGAGAGILLSLPTWGAPALDFSIPQHYVSPRALGMGNAFTAVADDHSAMFYNPAALARRTEGNLHFFLRGALDSEFLGLSDDIAKADSTGTEAEQVDNMIKLLESHYGDHFYSRLPALGGFWARPNWGVAVIPADLSLDLSLHQQIGPMINVNGYLDTTIAYAYARDVKWGQPEGHRLSAGITGKVIHRIYGGTAVSAGELAAGGEVFDKDVGDEGLTVDADVGLLYDPKIPESGFLSTFALAKPTFAFVIRNLLDYGFTTNLHMLSETSGEPTKLGRRFDFGSKWDLPDFWVFDPHMSVDIRDVGHENWSIMKGLHIGAELFWKMTSWWKGSWSVGLNQGYLSAGFGARFAWFELGLATWGEEVGTSDARKENRRYMVELSIDI
ncbi:MAG: hypothetical protein IT288_08430 [Bdellovibrionales bacterium]|nr:hypothetical protein [Bdellovibrionales bacterium]